MQLMVMGINVIDSLTASVVMQPLRLLLLLWFCWSFWLSLLLDLLLFWLLDSSVWIILDESGQKTIFDGRDRL